MSDDDDKVFLTPEQAIQVIGDGDRIHTFRSGPMCAIGCDWDRADLIQAINAAPVREIAGPGARGMKHGLAINSDGWLFIETNEEKLAALESELVPANSK